MLVAVVIVTLLTALVVQGWRANRRETILRERLHLAETQKAISEIAVRELDAVRQMERHQLRSQIARQYGGDRHADVVVPADGSKR